MSHFASYNQSLTPSYESSTIVLSDNSKTSYNKIYTVTQDSWFVCEHTCTNGYGWGHVWINDINVVAFRAMPLDETNYAVSTQTIYVPKNSTLKIIGNNGMTVRISKIN